MEEVVIVVMEGKAMLLQENLWWALCSLLKWKVMGAFLVRYIRSICVINTAKNLFAGVGGLSSISPPPVFFKHKIYWTR